jgi:hypothetical protein
MRSSAGIVAGLFMAMLVANCGDDSNGGSPGGSGSTGEGGESGSNPTAGSSSAGKMNTAGSMNPGGGGEGGTGTPTPTGCMGDDDCEDTQQCIDTVCKNNDGEACTGADDCVNNCIDDECTSLLPDGEACTLDEECAHTCIGEMCAPQSTVGGDCDVPDDGAGGAGGGGAGGNGAGGAPAAPPNPDCAEPLECTAGTCLTPDGEACADNVDCINTCVDSVCAPKGGVDADCDDDLDCAVQALICDPNTSKCKLDLGETCTDDSQCRTENCICANNNCATRTCKTANSSCLCRFSEGTTCSVQSGVLLPGVEDPKGCTAATNNYCNQGQCVPNSGGSCTMPCAVNNGGTPDDPADDTCNSSGAPTGCNPGYHAVIDTQCTMNKAVCGGTCHCVLN